MRAGPWLFIAFVVGVYYYATGNGLHEMASFALIESRGAGRMAFGGFFPGGLTWALMRSAEPDSILADLADTGFWKPGTLTARPLLHVL